MVGLGVAEAKLYAAVADELPVRVPKVWHSSPRRRRRLVRHGPRGPRRRRVPLPQRRGRGRARRGRVARRRAGQAPRGLLGQGPAVARHPRPQPRGQPRGPGAHVDGGDDRPVRARPVRRRPPAGVQRPRRALHRPQPRDRCAVERGRAHPDPRRRPHRQPVHRGRPHRLLRLGRRLPVPGHRATSPTSSATRCRPTLRRANEDALIARYRAGLAAGGVDLDADLAQEQYRLFSIYSWIAATTTSAMGSKWQPPRSAGGPWSAPPRPSPTSRSSTCSTSDWVPSDDAPTGSSTRVGRERASRLG